MTTFQWLALAGLGAAMLPALNAESRCPGDVASIRPRFTGRSLITVPVMLNNTGPYDFVLDTGAQITTIDPQLESALHPARLSATHVTGVGTYSRAAYAQMGSLEAGNFTIKDPLVLVQDLRTIQQTDSRIRGILGLNFLEHFDLLIDYEHRRVCLDDSKQMQDKVKGMRIPMAPPLEPDRYLPSTLPMVMSVRLSAVAERPLLLQLDSGIDVPVLFECAKHLPRVQTVAISNGHNSGEVVEAFAVLAPQKVLVGDQLFSRLSFVTPIESGGEIPVKPDIDGLLPTILFRRVLISYSDRFAVLQP
jgi:hypothetical protein